MRGARGLLRRAPRRFAVRLEGRACCVGGQPAVALGDWLEQRQPPGGGRVADLKGVSLEHEVTARDEAPCTSTEVGVIFIGEGGIVRKGLPALREYTFASPENVRWHGRAEVVGVVKNQPQNRLIDGLVGRSRRGGLRGISDNTCARSGERR